VVEVIHIRETALLKVNNFRTMVKLIASLRFAAVNPTIVQNLPIQESLQKLNTVPEF